MKLLANPVLGFPTATQLVQTLQTTIEAAKQYASMNQGPITSPTQDLSEQTTDDPASMHVRLLDLVSSNLLSVSQMYGRAGRAFDLPETATMSGHSTNVIGSTIIRGSDQPWMKMSVPSPDDFMMMASALEMITGYIEAYIEKYREEFNAENSIRMMIRGSYQSAAEDKGMSLELYLAYQSRNAQSLGEVFDILSPMEWSMSETAEFLTKYPSADTIRVIQSILERRADKISLSEESITAEHSIDKAEHFIETILRQEIIAHLMNAQTVDLLARHFGSVSSSQLNFLADERAAHWSHLASQQDVSVSQSVEIDIALATALDRLGEREKTLELLHQIADTLIPFYENLPDDFDKSMHLAENNHEDLTAMLCHMGSPKYALELYRHIRTDSASMSSTADKINKTSLVFLGDSDEERSIARAALSAAIKRFEGEDIRLPQQSKAALGILLGSYSSFPVIEAAISSPFEEDRILAQDFLQRYVDKRLNDPTLYEREEEWNSFIMLARLYFAAPLIENKSESLDRLASTGQDLYQIKRWNQLLDVTEILSSYHKHRDTVMTFLEAILKESPVHHSLAVLIGMTILRDLRSEASETKSPSVQSLQNALKQDLLEHIKLTDRDENDHDASDDISKMIEALKSSRTSPLQALAKLSQQSAEQAPPLTSWEVIVLLDEIDPNWDQQHP